MSEIKYKRILLKVSGEALGEKTAAGDGFGLDFSKIRLYLISDKPNHPFHLPYILI